MNLFEEHSSHYDVLELTADATPQEIRSAYLRLKSAYSKDNIAHYTLFSRDETESVLQKIENAYIILSNPEKRRAYDQAQGLTQIGSTPLEIGHQAYSPNDFAAGGYGLNVNPTSTFDTTDPFASSPPFVGSPQNRPPLNPPRTSTTLQSDLSYSMGSQSEIDTLIAAEKEWSGAFLKRIRELKKMTLDDLSDYTRISRIYLHAIEEEDFKKLPAAVYVRGFLQQVGKRLKLPVEPLVQHYLERYKSNKS